MSKCPAWRKLRWLVASYQNRGQGCFKESGTAMELVCDRVNFRCSIGSLPRVQLRFLPVLLFGLCDALSSSPAAWIVGNECLLGLMNLNA